MLHNTVMEASATEVSSLPAEGTPFYSHFLSTRWKIGELKRKRTVKFVLEYICT